MVGRKWLELLAPLAFVTGLAVALVALVASLAGLAEVAGLRLVAHLTILLLAKVAGLVLVANLAGLLEIAGLALVAALAFLDRRGRGTEVRSSTLRRRTGRGQNHPECCDQRYERGAPKNTHTR